MRSEFRLLGEVEVRIDGRPLDIGHARQRCVLAVLLFEANRPVSVDQLVDRIWAADRLPDRPANAVQTYLSLLRRALARGNGVAIVRQPAGYRLVVDEDTVDLHQFRDLIDRARVATDDHSAAALLEQALELWRGEPFAALDTPWTNTVRSTLTEQRQAAWLDLSDIRLRLGQHSALIAELTDQASQHPLDERMAGQLMLALYRSGRQAEALERYRLIWRLLIDELGTEPGPPLRELHQRMLAADPALDLPVAGSPVGPARQAVVPRQLPAQPRLFTGRVDELARLGKALDAVETSGPTVVISAIGGAGGMGKTWLALHWAHQHLDRFPDGQLQVNLRGFDPSGTPMPPAVAVRGFLDALGVEPAAVPPDLDAQVGLYRSLVAGKRMLIMLDNAADTAQVTPLLPGSPTCAVLVTSRRHLTGLVTAHGARALDLDVLTEAEARELLTRQIGADRLAAEPEAASQLLAGCAGLPLALGIVAARATSHPDFPLSALAEELRDHTNRLDALDAGDTQASVRAVLSWSHDALPAASATVFGLLGLAPGPDIGLPAASSLAALSPAQVRAVLRDLDDAHLVGQHSPGRFRLHDLIRLYAVDTAHRSQSASARTAALRRLVDHYLHTAFTADRLLEAVRPPIRLDDPVAGCRPQSLDGETAALAWFTAEHANLLAAQQLAADHGWHTHVWQLAWAMSTFHNFRGHVHDALEVWRAALTAADLLGDPATRTLAHRRVGNACTRTGLHDAALQHLQQALALAEHAGDLPGQAHTHQTLATAWSAQGDIRRAVLHDTHAVRLFGTLDLPVGRARALNTAGWHYALLGDHSQARAHCEAALALFRRHPDRHGEARTLDSLGYIAYHSGRHTEASDHYRQALAIFRDLGDTYELAATLERLAEAHDALGEDERALASWRQALALYQAQHRAPDADRVRQRLDSLRPAATAAGL